MEGDTFIIIVYETSVLLYTYVQESSQITRRV